MSKFNGNHSSAASPSSLDKVNTIRQVVTDLSLSVSPDQVDSEGNNLKLELKQAEERLLNIASDIKELGEKTINGSSIPSTINGLEKVLTDTSAQIQKSKQKPPTEEAAIEVKFDKSKYLYMTNPEKFSHTTIITQVTDNPDGTVMLELNETIFHPQGGGQPCDAGTINNIPVTRVDKLGSNTEFKIGHTLPHPNGKKFTAGETVTLEVDEKVRTLHSKLHTAGHLISNVVQDMYHHTYKKCHLFPQIGVFLVFTAAAVQTPASDSKNTKGKAKSGDSPVMSPQDIQRIVEECNKTIQQNPEITETTTEDGLRAIQIGDLSPFPCGGTHIPLSKIGAVFITSVNKKKDEIRVTFNVGSPSNS